jgi:hypothetical protein
MAVSRQVKPTTRVKNIVGDHWFDAKDLPWLFSDKNWLVAVLLAFFLGPSGSTGSTSATPGSGSPSS